jgi:hypothetical protein
MRNIEEIFDALAFVALVGIAFVAMRGVAVNFHAMAIIWNN